MEPDHIPVKLAQVKIMIQAKHYDAAREVLNTVPADVGISPEAKKLLAELEFAQAATTEYETRELQTIVADNPDDLNARYQLSACNVVAGDFEAAMDQLLEIMKRDRNFQDDAGRKGMLSVFDMLGGSGELVSRYRSKLSSLLY